MTPPIIAFCGPSNSGKTTFLSQLIQYFRLLDLHIGALKHCHCAIADDETGKDSQQLRLAGADPSLAIHDIAQIPALLQSHFSTHDLIIAEGFRRLDLPSILLYRQSIPKDWNRPAHLIGSIFLPSLDQDPPIEEAITIINAQLPFFKRKVLDRR